MVTIMGDEICSYCCASTRQNKRALQTIYIKNAVIENAVIESAGIENLK
jgi:hypothetical protein